MRERERARMCSARTVPYGARPVAPVGLRQLQGTRNGRRYEGNGRRQGIRGHGGAAHKRRRTWCCRRRRGARGRAQQAVSCGCCRTRRGEYDLWRR